MILFLCNALNRQIYKEKVNQTARGWGEEEMGNKYYWFKFGGDKNVLKLIVLMAP